MIPLITGLCSETDVTVLTDSMTGDNSIKLIGTTDHRGSGYFSVTSFGGQANPILTHQQHIFIFKDG